ncbi:MAG: hypothetical protein ACLSAP_00910 [Oscillospiraceae bacterium]
MFKNRKRKIAVALTAAMLLGSVCVGNVGAYAPTVSGYANGVLCTGYATLSDKAGTAYTSCGSYGTLHAKATYYYYVNGKPKNSYRSADNSDYSVTAVVNNPGSDGAFKTEGKHSVYCSDGYWGEYTTEILK